MNQQRKPVAKPDVETQFETREAAQELGPREEAELRLQNLYEKLDVSKIGVKSEHLKRLIRKVEVGKQPTAAETALWGTDRPILTFGNETMYVYDGFRRENIDRDHAVAHETSEAIMASGLFRGTSWAGVTGELGKGGLEDTGYVRGIRNELEALADPAVLARKAQEVKMDPEAYRGWMGKRVHHEQFAEALTFYLRSGGDEQEMLALHMEHVPKESLPVEWQEALEKRDKAEVARLYKESGLEERNRYLFEIFHKTLGEKTSDEISTQLDIIEEEEFADEEYGELLALEMEERNMVFENSLLAQPPKTKKEPSFWESLKNLFGKI